MKKIKDLWMNNRVLLVLCIVVVLCFIIIAIVCANLFFGNSSSVYGDRLDGMDQIPLKEEDQAKIIDKIKENEEIQSVEVRTQGKIIYIRIEVNNMTLEKAKEVASSSLEVIEDDYKAAYDIHYTLVHYATEAVPAYTIMGAKNINRSMILWNNNNPMPEQTEE